MSKFFKDSFYLKIYKKNVDYLICDIDEAKKYIQKAYDCEWEKEKQVSGSTLIVPYKNSQVYILWMNKFDNNVLAHEATHLAGFILKDVGSNCPADDEVFAYLVEYIVKDFSDSYKRWRKK